jgi:hypothetical protein
MRIKRVFSILILVVFLTSTNVLGNVIKDSLKGAKKVKEFNADLNGDNKQDKITLYYNNNGTNIVDINGFTYKFNTGDDIAQIAEIKAIDINKNDKYKEIEISSTGSSDSLHSVALKYDGNKIIEIWNLDCVNVTYDGSGIIKVEEISQIFYTWDYIDTYKYNGAVIKLIPPKYYTLNTETTVITPIKLQKSPADKTESFKLIKGEKVKIVMADNNGWFMLVNSKGKQGWFYCDKNDYVQGKEQYDIFSDLPIAD